MPFRIRTRWFAATFGSTRNSTICKYIIFELKPGFCCFNLPDIFAYIYQKKYEEKAETANCPRSAKSQFLKNCAYEHSKYRIWREDSIILTDFVRKNSNYRVSQQVLDEKFQWKSQICASKNFETSVKKSVKLKRFVLLI